MPFDQQGYTGPATEAIATETEPKLWPIYLGLFLLVAAWATSVVIWGIPGLYMPAVLAVPIVMAVLVRLVLGLI